VAWNDKRKCSFNLNCNQGIQGVKLIKTSLFSGIITVVRVLAGFVSTKFVAIYVGPAGVALVGQFINLITVVTTFANGAINNGVIKYTAEYNSDEPKLKSLFSTALKISIICSVLVGGVLIAMSSYISIGILNSYQYAWTIKTLGGGIILYSLNTLLVSILNGRGQIRDFTIVNVCGSLISLVLTILLVHYYKVSGALLSIALAPSIVFFVTVAMILNSSWFDRNFFLQRLDRSMAVKLFHFSAMAIISVLTIPLSQMFLRGVIIEKFGMQSAGYWQGMMRISDAYLLVVTTALSTYYLPRLSSIKEDSLIRHEILSGYKIVLPFVLLSCLFIFFVKSFVISLLYSEEFLPMEDLFLFQLLGDFFKIAAWMLAFLMQAKAMTRIYIASEIGFTVLYIVLSLILTDIFGLEGVVIAFSLNYLIYLITMIFLFRNILFSKLK
jgi:O-antigen/teichoic acid export membrane protein